MLTLKAAGLRSRINSVSFIFQWQSDLPDKMIPLNVMSGGIDVVCNSHGQQ